MTEQPRFPDAIKRLHALRWSELLEKHCLTGDHLLWHQSTSRISAAARPNMHPHTPIEYDDWSVIGLEGNVIAYEDWLVERDQLWQKRKNDPGVVDSIGLNETILLARERFLQLAGDYRALWASGTSVDHNSFSKWLAQLQQSVASQVSELWGSDEWHTAWFERVVKPKLQRELTELVEIETRRARSLEIAHLAKPEVPLAEIAFAPEDIGSSVYQHLKENQVAQLDERTPLIDVPALSVNSASAVLTQTSPAQVSQAVPAMVEKRRRGRPPVTSVEKKEEALKLKREGATNAQVAALIYGTSHPTFKQTKNVPSILKHFEKSKSSDSHPPSALFPAAKPDDE